MHLFTCCEAGYIIKVILWSWIVQANVTFFVCLVVYLLIWFVCKLVSTKEFNKYIHSFIHSSIKR